MHSSFPFRSFFSVHSFSTPSPPPHPTLIFRLSNEQSHVLILLTRSRPHTPTPPPVLLFFLLHFCTLLPLAHTSRHLLTICLFSVCFSLPPVPAVVAVSHTLTSASSLSQLWETLALVLLPRCPPTRSSDPTVFLTQNSSLLHHIPTVPTFLFSLYRRKRRVSKKRTSQNGKPLLRRRRRPLAHDLGTDQTHIYIR